MNKLWQTTKQISAQALQSGHLLPIATQSIQVEQDDIHWNVQMLHSNILKKQKAKQKPGNPFLPYEPELFISDIDDNYVCLLNKFPVLNNHLLFCTRTFIQQSQPLELFDFQAWIKGFVEAGTLGFYNGGETAGASQPHRHLQLVKCGIPLDNIILKDSLLFRHRTLHFSEFNSRQLYEFYLDTLNDLQLYHPDKCQPYNILLTDKWMVILPRTRKELNGIYANSLNFSGNFLVKDHQQLDWLVEFGFMKFLNQLTV